MTAVVCVSKSWGIGNDGALLFHISDDLKRFRALTTGKSVILGRKTLSTFPGGKPLKNRRNIVLTRSVPAIEGAEVARTAEEAIALAGEEAVVIGGASVYAALLARCERVYVTKVEADCAADSFFPDLDALPEWRVERAGEEQEENGLRFRYIDYVRA